VDQDAGNYETNGSNFNKSWDLGENDHRNDDSSRGEKSNEQ
jgi:hypothetical protein